MAQVLLSLDTHQTRPQPTVRWVGLYQGGRWGGGHTAGAQEAGGRGSSWYAGPKPRFVHCQIWSLVPTELPASRSVSVGGVDVWQGQSGKVEGGQT